MSVTIPTAKWNGSDGRFNDPRNWTPAGVPGQFGPIAVVSSGVAHAGNEIVNSIIDLGSSQPIHDPNCLSTTQP